MTRQVAFAILGLCLVATQAWAGDGSSAPATIVVASSSGLSVRASAPAVRSAQARGNVYASAINTAGVVRATRAVTINGRVKLVGNAPSLERSVRLAAARIAPPAASQQGWQPMGLGALLARLLGFTGS